MESIKGKILTVKTFQNNISTALLLWIDRLWIGKSLIDDIKSGPCGGEFQMFYGSAPVKGLESISMPYLDDYLTREYVSEENLDEKYPYLFTTDISLKKRLATYMDFRLKDTSLGTVEFRDVNLMCSLFSKHNNGSMESRVVKKYIPHVNTVLDQVRFSHLDIYLGRGLEENLLLRAELPEFRVLHTNWEGNIPKNGFLKAIRNNLGKDSYQITGQFLLGGLLNTESSLCNKQIWEFSL